MPKIAIVGAGSFVFARRLVTDILTWPSLQDSTIALMDIDETKLETMAALTQRMVGQTQTGATVEATTDLRAALDGADYVTVSIRVGQGREHIEIPQKYGIDQAIGDTTGPGGVFYFIRNAPAMINIARTMEEVCPGAWMLNYTNPMVMLCWAIEQMSSIRYVGLCHSVQGTAMALADYIGAPFNEVSYWVAGINHMAWFLKFLWNGQDAYPLLWEAMKAPEIYERDIVKWEIMKHFGMLPGRYVIGLGILEEILEEEKFAQENRITLQKFEEQAKELEKTSMDYISIKEAIEKLEDEGIEKKYLEIKSLTDRKPELEKEQKKANLEKENLIKALGDVEKELIRLNTELNKFVNPEKEL